MGGLRVLFGFDARGSQPGPVGVGDRQVAREPELGVTLGQLADYVAMSGFAKLKSDAHLADGTTILTLFNETSAAAPTALTDWDQTFLKSLYSTEPRSKLQRNEITHQMVHDMAP